MGMGIRKGRHQGAFHLAPLDATPQRRSPGIDVLVSVACSYRDNGVAPARTDNPLPVPSLGLDFGLPQGSRPNRSLVAHQVIDEQAQ